MSAAVGVEAGTVLTELLHEATSQAFMNVDGGNQGPRGHIANRAAVE